MCFCVAALWPYIEKFFCIRTDKLQKLDHRASYLYKRAVILVFFNSATAAPRVVDEPHVTW